MFTYDQGCHWVSSKETIQLNCIMDERICGDTIFRAEMVSKNKFMISDVWLYNSSCIFAYTNFEQRYTWIPKILNRFHKHFEGFVSLIHKSQIETFSSKGSECYTDDPGTVGFFVEELTNMHWVTKSEIPDVYKLDGFDGYLRVPSLELSQYLRTLGNRFQIECTKNEDDSWTVHENIPISQVNASS